MAIAIKANMVSGSPANRRIRQLTTENSELASHAALVNALREPAAYPHAVDAVEVIETHISSVLLAGDYAYKLKKPVNLGFVDFSDLARRRHFCEAEIRLNSRTAPGLYLDVVPVTCAQPGAVPRMGGTGQAVDFAVRMRRFAHDARLDQMARAGTLDSSQIDQLARAIGAFHAHCEPAPSGSPFGAPEEIRRWTQDNLSELRGLAVDPAQLQRIEQFARWTEVEFTSRAEVFAQRRVAGCVRECHGDLHLGNVVLIDGQLVPFDCIEFNPQLRFIDVMSDVAFTWMDLFAHGLPGLAWRFLNAYLEVTGDYSGLETLRFYAVYRALVRAKVALIRLAQPEISTAERDFDAQSCARYLAVAEQLVQASPPRLVLTCGVTGSGKTTVSQHLLEVLGAVRVRSDIERKRLAGIGPTDRAPAAVGAGLYEPAITHRAYELLSSVASTIIDAGFPAIVDATFLHRAERLTFSELAKQHRAHLTIVVCEATTRTLRSRVAARAARGTDASDATLEVLAHQLAIFEAPLDDEAALVQRIDTQTDPRTLANRCEGIAAWIGSSK